uniref:Uncharacterized protein n=1 Tax=Crocodylus porosus TaxID=8502 RepID=A0A7M4EWX5_CROPO
LDKPPGDQSMALFHDKNKDYYYSVVQCNSYSVSTYLPYVVIYAIFHFVLHRYGFIEDKIVLPRINPYHLCLRLNLSGHIIPQFTEWLIIVAALVALILILAVCIAVNSRRRCGQKKKLVINNGKGAVEDKKIGGLNGEASKSQEMVHLVHKEQSNDRTEPYEFLTSDETQNQEADMKTGV